MGGSHAASSQYKVVFLPSLPCARVVGLPMLQPIYEEEKDKLGGTTGASVPLSSLTVERDESIFVVL